MGSTFIGQTLEAYEAQGDHAFEDFLVRAEMEHMKRLIAKAIRRGKSYTFCRYRYNPRDAADPNQGTDLLIDDDVRRAKQLAAFKEADSGGLGLGRIDGLDSFLSHYVQEQAPHYRGSVDFAYIRKCLERKLLALGCKDVYLRIGPETFRASKGVWRKGLFGERERTVTVTETTTDDNWLISVYW